MSSFSVLLGLLALLAVATAVSFRFQIIRKRKAATQTMTASGALLSRSMAGTLVVVGVGIIALMIHVFYFE
jgi:hypothetical protein